MSSAEREMAFARHYASFLRYDIDHLLKALAHDNVEMARAHLHDLRKDAAQLDAALALWETAVKP